MTAAPTGNPYRLPRSIVPTRYKLTLQPDLDAASFVGSVDIEVAANEPVEQIVLNAIELGIERVAVDGETRSFVLDESTERLLIDAPQAVGTAVVSIDFTGTLNDKLRGWYRSTYQADDGSERVIATSQMQVTDCRRAFPCFDEPEFKAVFDVTLIVEPDLLAVSNGPEVERTELDSGKVAIRYGETMPMSTYLVAFVVGPLEATEPVAVDTGRGRDRAAAHHPRAGQGPPHRLRRRGRPPRDHLVPGLLRDPLPDRQVRHGRPAGLRHGRDGEPRADHLPGVAAAGRPGHGDPGRAAEPGRRHHPRAGPHVVRRPGDDALVERHLAERGGTAEGVLEASEHEMVTNVLNLDERHVAGVLTPRSDVVFLDMHDSVERNRERLRQEPHPVLPLCDGGLQHVIGFVRATRVLEQVLDGQSVDLAALAEPALFVPETMTIMALLEQFKRTNLPAALVVDEFGEVAGMVSLTDVISAIVGDLPTESDQEPMIVKRDDGSWLLDGTIDLATMVRALGDDSILTEDDKSHYHTLGGLAMVSLRRVPRTGDVFERGRYRFEVVDMDGNRVDRVMVNRIDPNRTLNVPKEG